MFGRFDLSIIFIFFYGHLKKDYTTQLSTVFSLFSITLVCLKFPVELNKNENLPFLLEKKKRTTLTKLVTLHCIFSLMNAVHHNLHIFSYISLLNVKTMKSIIITWIYDVFDR